jgi:hypothetical protein
LSIQLQIFNLCGFIVHLAAGVPICQLNLGEAREVPTMG